MPTSHHKLSPIQWKCKINNRQSHSTTQPESQATCIDRCTTRENKNIVNIAQKPTFDM